MTRQRIAKLAGGIFLVGALIVAGAPLAVTAPRKAGDSAGRSAPQTSAQNAPVAAAEQTLRAYYQALNRGQYRVAYRYWGTRRGENASGKTQAAFVAGFKHTKASDLRIGRAQKPERAAGSVYVTIPVRVSTTLDSGKTRYFAGIFILRRIDTGNDAPSWHLYDAALSPAER